MGNDLATLPDFPAEIRAPAGSLPGVSGFQVHFADHEIFTPGDQPNVLVAMNPAALKTNLEGPAEGRRADRQHRRLQRAQPAEGGVRGEPARRRHARRLPRARGGADVDDGRGAEGGRGDHLARGGALEELLRARADAVALPPADRGDARLHRGEVRQEPRDRRGEHARLQGGLQLRRDVRGLRRLVRDRAGAAAARPLPPDHGQHRDELRPDRGLEALGPAAVPRRLPDHAGLLDPRGALAPQELRRHDLPGGGRDRSLRRRARRLVRRVARRHDLGRAGHRAQGRDGRARRHARAAAPDPRHPAGRPLDRDADEARAGRPADGAVRPQRREPRAGGRRVEPVAVLPRRDRGGPDRAQVPHARLPPLRRRPRERLRALADPGRRRAAVDRDRVRDGAERRRDVPSVPARSRDARAPVGAAGHAGPRPPDRRAREGGRDRRDLVRPRQPRPDGPAARPEGREHRSRHPASSRSTMPTATRGRSCSAGARPTARSAPRCGGCGGRAQGRERPPPPSEPVPAQPRRRAAPLRQGARARR